ncbi:hypothetical protein [Burkholderia sp. BCC0397]|uniref:beta strand repeat-containing protein n=1 Tax=Burkholderia sp. BCC0397 TaxID=486876 RepID=UPI00158921DA|nr:hypothetical protein [Burkholderia sp. BCC0397]
MKAAIALLCVMAMFVGTPANAQFNPGQVLKATDLNAAIASPTITGGTINGSVIGGTNPKAGTFTALNVTGSLTATGLVTLPSLATQAANTVIANATGSTASPTAFTMPSCSGANNALRWTSGTGFACASSIALTSSGLNQFAATTSAQLSSIVSDETGSGSLVFGTNPTIAGATFTAPTSITGNGTTLTVSNGNNTDALDIYGTTGGNGAIVKLIGNGSTTPSKTIRVAGGTFSIINDAFSNSIFSLTDAGSMTASGGLNNTAIGNVTASTGAFTTVSASGSVSANARLFVSDSTNSPTTLSVTNAGSNGANILLAGNGATTPNKSIRANGGYLQFCNSAYTACPVTISDVGNVSSAGGIDNTAIGAATPNSGAFTTLTSTGTTGLGTPTSIGTSVFPTIVAPISTTATTTNGSTSITVTSSTGIAVGMGIYGSFSPNQCGGNETGFMGVYVTGISGSTVTMSCAANATNTTPVAVQFGQQRYSPTSTILASDVGTQTLKVGSAAQGNSAAWLNQISTGQDYRLTSAAQIIAPPGGGYGITVASRTSDATGGAVAFPLQALFYADSGNPNGSEVAYFQSNLNPATAGHGPHIQFEQTIESAWATGPEDPYTINAINATIAHRIDCGSGGPGGIGPTDQNCTTAIDIVPNNQAFENGIVFASGSLDPAAGRNALSMPLNYATTWFSGANQYSAFVTSNVAGSLLFGTPSGGQYNFQVNGATAAQVNSSGVNAPIGQTTPAAGAFTNLTSSGTTSFAGTAGTAASAGTVGEVKSSLFSNTSMTSGTVANLASINLTAGVYLVWGSATYSTGTGATMNSWLAGASQNSGALPALGTYFQGSGTVGSGLASTANAPMQFITLTSSASVYLTGEALFGGGSVTATGFLAAHRIH